MSKVSIRCKTNRSQSFLDFIQSVGDTKSKLEEEKIVFEEIKFLKSMFKGIEPYSNEMKEAILRALYCELLGYDVEFAHIHAIKLISSVYNEEKSIGYSASTTFLSPTHEFLYLMISNLQKDLKSTSYVELGIALEVVTNIMDSEISDVFVDEVIRLCESENSYVRKKALVASLALMQGANVWIPQSTLYRLALSDTDPQVMNVALSIMEVNVRLNPLAHADTIPSLLGIFRQILDHRLPHSYDFHRIPAPWMQIQIIRILRIFLQNSRAQRDECISVFKAVLKRSDIDLNIGIAVIYEVIRALCVIDAPRDILDHAALHASGWISSDDSNRVFIGIKALSSLVAVDPSFAMPHQDLLLDLWEDEDCSIRAKAVDLLCTMTNYGNVDLISEKLVEYLEKADDEGEQKMIVENLSRIINAYYHDAFWYVDIMIMVFIRGSKHIRPEAIHNFLEKLSQQNIQTEEFLNDEEKTDDALRLHAVRELYAILENCNQADPISKVAVWIFGEYSFLDSEIEGAAYIERICDIMNRKHLEAETKCWALMSSLKVIARDLSTAGLLRESINDLMQTDDEFLLGECIEAMATLNDENVLAALLSPKDFPRSDFWNEWLSPFIHEALEKGSKLFDESEVERLVVSEELIQSDAYQVVRQEDIASLAQDLTENLVLTSRVNKWSKEAISQGSTLKTIPVANNLKESTGKQSNEESLKETENVGRFSSDLVGHSVPSTLETERERFAHDIFHASSSRAKNTRYRTPLWRNDPLI